MTNYLHHLESGDPWFSPSFYTHKREYQIHLRIDANLHKGGNVSVVACVLKGEYDHLLQWPLCAELEVDLFNWRDSDRSYTKTLYLSGDHFCSLMPTKKLAEWGKGDTYFIAHYELGYNPGKNSEYLLHNCLSFQVKKVAILANAVPDLPTWALGNCLSQFAITSFLQNKARNASFYGPPFYTNSRGYKLVVFANPNGFDTGKDTHVSLSVLLMKGEYDDSLIWPFSGDVVVTMLNWRQDKNHQECVISLSRGISNTSADRVLTTNIAPTSWGIPQFISHSALSYKHSSNTEYLKNNCLLIKVKSVEVYSFYDIPKVLSWKQHPHNTQTCCEFVLSHFTKRKQLKSYYCSDPFFTHRNGYKMQIKVNANNSDHIGVYVHLIKSSNDDNLMWPFHGDVVVELLNYREDKSHHRIVIELSPDVTNTTCNTVVTGDRGSECWGYPHFISHSALGYNSSKNTQYLQDDCLHFRVKEVIVHSSVLARRLPRWQNPQSVSPYLEFTVPNFSKVKELGTTYISPTFFTHHQGYKLRLEVKANKRNEIYYVSIYARLLKGDNDDNLVWPFRADIVIELLNWRQNVNHQKYTISIHERTPDRCTNRVLSGNKALDSMGTHQLIPYSNLTYNSKTNTEYLQDDCLRLIVKEIVVYSTPHCKKIPIWQSYQPTNFFEFTITRFSQCIRLESTYFSLPFYTSSRGHKMCLKVYSAGDRAGNKGTHMSAYGFLLKGEYDDSLSWPFYADVVIDILNWRGDHSHHRKVLQFDDDSCANACARVYDDDALAPSVWGNSKVIQLSTLFPRYASATQYLEDDCMRIRIYDVALYNTSLLNKTPQWQNSWNTSSSWPIEVTVTGFHKHKMYNTEHISPPFYTHKNGYKMRLEVHPNGNGDGKGTHLSIFARLLKGENDYDLKWPMDIDLTLELVNWRKNNSHIPPNS